jgi:hypothetical protein
VIHRLIQSLSPAENGRSNGGSRRYVVGLLTVMLQSMP